MDTYTLERGAQYSDPSVQIDARLIAIVEKLFAKCIADGEYEQAIGMALESFRLDIVKEAISKGKNTSLLAYLLKSAMTVVEHVVFRSKVFQLLVDLFKGLAEPDYFSVCVCHMHLNDPKACADMLRELCSKDEHHSLIAYQIAFDLEENATQEFLQKVLDSFPEKDADAMDTDGQDDSSLGKIRTALTGDLAIKLNLEFLHSNSHADLLLLKNEKMLESKASLYHSAVSLANAFMNAGTTSDEFLRQNLEWLSRANNWTKFSATAALGVIHRGHISKGKTLLAPYLPKDGVSGSAYQEGGALYALGLIHANHGHGVIDYLVKALKNTQNETVQHGACLGIGVSGMAIANESVYEDLKGILFTDSAVAGEAAGLAMGLVMMGTASPKPIEEMLQYAHETQHEKIIRGLSVGISMIMYGKEEVADSLIEQLLSDKVFT